MGGTLDNRDVTHIPFRNRCSEIIQLALTGHPFAYARCRKREATVAVGSADGAKPWNPSSYQHFRRRQSSEKSREHSLQEEWHRDASYSTMLPVAARFELLAHSEESMRQQNLTPPRQTFVLAVVLLCGLQDCGCRAGDLMFYCQATTVPLFGR